MDYIIVCDLREILSYPIGKIYSISSPVTVCYLSIILISKPHWGCDLALYSLQILLHTSSFHRSKQVITLYSSLFRQKRQLKQKK